MTAGAFLLILGGAIWCIVAISIAARRFNYWPLLLPAISVAGYSTFGLLSLIWPSWPHLPLQLYLIFAFAVSSQFIFLVRYKGWQPLEKRGITPITVLLFRNELRVTGNDQEPPS